MEEYNTQNTAEQGTGAPQPPAYKAGQTEKARKKGGAGGYVLTGLLCLLLGIALGAFGTAVVMTAVGVATSDVGSQIEDYFDENGSHFQWSFGEEQEPAEPDEDEETNAPTYTPRDLPTFDGALPAITDAANPIPDIVSHVTDGVVSVYVYEGDEGNEEYAGYGSGFVVSSDGFILTNAHIVKGMDKTTVSFAGSDEEEIEAEVVGCDVMSDVAVLKVDKTGLTPLVIGDSDSIRVGEFCIAVGNPDGSDYARTTTFGIISATGRTVNVNGYTNDYIQTDTAVNLGSSGGALLNLRGEVIGITNSKKLFSGYDDYGNTITTEGIGFAIPINEAMDVATQLITKGHIAHPALGVNVIGIDAENAEYYGIAEGIMVYSVTKNGPAHKAGVKVDDVIVEYDGKPVPEQDEFVKIVKSLNVGDTVHLKLWRAGEYVEADVTLGDANELGSALVGGESKLFD